MNATERISRTVLTLALLAAAARGAGAQEGGLMFRDAPSREGGPALTLENSSFLYEPLPPDAVSRELKEHDIITVLVDYRSTMFSEGEAESRKTATLNAVLAEWIGFDGKSVFRGPQSRGDPAIQGTLNSQYRAEGDLELRDSLTFRIAAEVTQIYPNGNLGIEAHRTIVINDEEWRQALTGIVARQSIGPDRTVRSDAISSLRIQKEDLGQVRNSYAPGWFGWWWSKGRAF